MTKLSTSEMFDLSGKSAIGTGAGMGIGKGFALRLAEAGAGILVTDIDLESANGTVDEIKTNGGKAEALQADAGSMDDIPKVIEATRRTLGSIDILVNNAGIYHTKPALEITEELWDGLMDVNIKGLFFLSRAVAQEMIKADRGGRIINIASKAAFHPTINMTPYDASKGGCHADRVDGAGICPP